MALLKGGAITKLVDHHHSSSSSSNSNHQLFRWKPSLPTIPTSFSLSNQGLQSYKYSSLRSTTSDETSSGPSPYVKDEPDGVINMEHRFPSEEKEYGETVEDETPQENPLLVAQKKISEFFNQLNLKISDAYINMNLDSEDSYSIFLYGGTATAALWFATVIVGSIESIPLFPKLMEAVGLGYTLWFCTRYLIFKSNRDELSAKIEEIKEKVLGSEDD